jgi:hypothetical protein
VSVGEGYDVMVKDLITTKPKEEASKRLRSMGNKKGNIGVKW